MTHDSNPNKNSGNGVSMPICSPYISSTVQNGVPTFRYLIKAMFSIILGSNLGTIEDNNRSTTSNVTSNNKFEYYNFMFVIVHFDLHLNRIN